MLTNASIQSVALATSQTSRSFIFLRRMRKAGSTTIDHFLHSHLCAANHTCDVFEVEDKALDFSCLAREHAITVLHSLGGRTVTHLRDPLSRINSEFWMADAGPGGALQ